MTRRRTVLLVLATLMVGLVFAFTRSDSTDEVERLARLLEVGAGATVAEIGAGSGWLAVEIARRVGPGGHVFATELNPRRRADIEAAAVEARLTNLSVVEAGEFATNLSPGCCDAVFMRRVYHHLTDAAAINADLLKVVRPGGRLAIIEFAPDGLFGRVTGMGIARDELIDQVTAAGFELVETDDWSGWGHFVAIFRAPTG